MTRPGLELQIYCSRGDHVTITPPMWLSEIYDDTQRTFCVFKLLIKTLYSGGVLLPVVKEKSEYKDTNKL